MFNLSEYLGSAYDEAEETTEVTTTSTTDTSTTTTSTTDTSTTDTSTTDTSTTDTSTTDTSTTDTSTTDTSTTDTSTTETVAAATNYVSGSSGNRSLDALLGIQSSTTTTNNAFASALANGTASTDTLDATDVATAVAIANSPYVYESGYQVISDYTSGDPILLGASPTDATYVDGDFYLITNAGTLVVENAANKLIDFEDANGNDLVKVYAPTGAGLIDGRGYDGFEFIAGADAGADLIFAGDDGSSMYGGFGTASDTLIGGSGTDIFVSGKYQGTDVIGNAQTKDIVNVTDATLSEIVSTNEQNGLIAVTFNNGNVIAVNSSEALSAAFQLADGSKWRYNHATKGWQSA